MCALWLFMLPFTIRSKRLLKRKLYPCLSAQFVFVFSAKDTLADCYSRFEFENCRCRLPSEWQRNGIALIKKLSILGPTSSRIINCDCELWRIHWIQKQIRSNLNLDHTTHSEWKRSHTHTVTPITGQVRGRQFKNNGNANKKKSRKTMPDGIGYLETICCARDARILYYVFVIC